MKTNIIEQTESFIKDHAMIVKGDVVVAGVSGGADSVCLLFVLCRLAEKMGFTVRVCHVNHGLRGADADADELFVRELCAALKVDARFFHADVELISRKRKQSCEEAGRAVRREAFEKMCAENGGTKIATAHHRQDNAETVILNIARGTGIKGVCGIWPVQGRWIRPLLCLDRAQIETFLIEQGIRWRTDATNEETVYTRNRIRHNILPLLKEQVNQGAVRHLDELAAQARELWEYLDMGTDRAWEQCVKETDRGVLIESGAFASQPRAVQKQLVKRCIAVVRGAQKDIGATHVHDVMSLFDKQSGRGVDLPGGVAARREYEGISIWKKQKKQEDTEVMLNIPGQTRTPAWGAVVQCRFIEGGSVKGAVQIPQKSYTKWIDYDIIKHGLCMRTRQSGDYLTVDDKGNRQKLKSYFINEKIPQEARGRLPLIADGQHIVWIPGCRMSRAYQVGEHTERILEIKITEERENGRDDQSAGSGGKS